MKKQKKKKYKGEIHVELAYLPYFSLRKQHPATVKS